MPINYKNIWNQNFAINAKNALISKFTDTAFQGLNLAQSPSLQYNISKRLIQGGLFSLNTSESNNIQIQNKKTDDINVSFEQNNQQNFDGKLNNVILENFTLYSKFVNRNFFDQTLNVVDEIEIEILIGDISVNYTNNFVESSPVGYAGTQKEWVGSSNFNLNLDGIFFTKYIGEDVNNPEQNFPDLNDFIRMCVRNKQCSVISPIIQNKFGIDLTNCVILSFDLPGDSTFKNIQRFSLTLSTDNLINIQ